MEFVGSPIEEAFPPLAETDIPENYRKAAAEGIEWKTDRFDFEHGEIKGAYEVHAFQTSPMYMVATFTDKYDRIKTEENLKNKILELEQRVEELTKQSN